MYRTLETTFWTDPLVMSWPYPTRYLYCYLLQSPQCHFSGIYYCPLVLMAHQTGLPMPLLEEGIDTLSIAYRIRIDPVSEVVWVVRKLSYQPQNPKLLVAVARQLETLHNSPLIQEFLEYYDTLSIPYRGAIEGVSIQRNRKQEQEQKQIVPASLQAYARAPVNPQDAQATNGQPASPPPALAPGIISEELQEAIRNMQVEGFHCLADPTKANQVFWNAQLELIEHQEVDVFDCLLNVDAHYASRPEDCPKDRREAGARMKKALRVAVNIIKEDRAQQERRMKHAKRAG